MSKKRIDLLLLEDGYFSSRERARAAVLSGCVLVDEEVIDKPGRLVGTESCIRVKEDPIPYVSRGGLKLVRALDAFRVRVDGKTCLDVGASTGGFTDVLVKQGANRVYAVDVGYGQLAWSLRSDARVIVMERTNARCLEPGMFQHTPELSTVDVSFISSRLILPAVFRVTTEGADVLLLVKPQFEAARLKVKKGVVRDPASHLGVLRQVEDFLAPMAFFLHGAVHSPIVGPAGNIEFWFHLSKSPARARVDLERTVLNAHDALRGGEVR